MKDSVYSTLPFTPLVQSLPASTPFVGPEALERQRGRQFKARIGANESAFGVSPHARQAMADALNQTSWYGDPECFELRQMLAEKHQVSIDEICVDAGIDSLLGLIVRMFVQPDTAVVSSQGAYPTFNYHIAGFGGRLCTVPYRDNHEDPEALLDEASRQQAPLVYLANPDNPMGTWHERQTIDQMINALPDGVVLALDEAYIEFAAPGIAPAIDTSNPGVVRLRTFSKAWGMAGMRIGYAIAHRDLITGLNKIRNHFGVNRVAQAGALASLQDPGFLKSVVDQVTRGRERIYALSEQLGLKSLPSATNFVAIQLGDAEFASRVMQRLHDKDVFVRMPGVAPLNTHIRLGVGSESEHQLLAEALGDAVKAG